MARESLYSTAALWTTTSHLGVVGSMLIRNVIFARFLNPTDFAIALTFGVVLSLFEYISNFGHENLMQRSKDGNLREFQSTMQFMMIARGLTIALVIVLVAPHIPNLLKIEKLDFDYALLAIVPLINGFAHLDHQRIHRKQIYTLSARISLISDALSILVALACVFIWNSYWAFYISFVFRHSISTLLSHIWSKRPYAINFYKKHAMALINFGAPLLAVGVLKYIGTEFDKAIVANVAGLDTFAIYVLTLMVMVNATNVVNVALAKIFIRRLSTAGDSIVKAIKTNGLVHCYLVLPLILILCFIGEDLITLIFGTQYSTIPFLILAVACVVGMRSMNQWLNQVVIARAPTRLMLQADIVRVVTAIVGLWLIYDEAGVIEIAMTFWLAELTYFVSLLLLLHKRFPLLKTGSVIFSIYFTCMIALLWGYETSHQGSLALKLLLVLISLCAFYGVFLTFSSTCRKQTISLYFTATKLIRV